MNKKMNNEKSKADIWGIQQSPDCAEHPDLVLVGAWSFYRRIYTDRFVFSCEKCCCRFVGSATEAEIHQDGIEARDHIHKAEQILKKHHPAAKIIPQLSDNNT